MALKPKNSMKAAVNKTKAKRVTKVAKGRLAKALVLRGSKEKTVGGLTRDALMRNKRGKVVSKRASAAGKRCFNNIQAWVDSVVEARRALHLSGFVAINGKSLQGKALYVKTKALCLARRGADSSGAEGSTARAAGSAASSAWASAAAEVRAESL